MKYPGHIRLIDNKVKFEYYELEKPKQKDYTTKRLFLSLTYSAALMKYEASKKVIEVNNEFYFDLYKNKRIVSAMEVSKETIYIKDNDSCEAEVENSVAVIVKIN